MRSHGCTSATIEHGRWLSQVRLRLVDGARLTSARNGRWTLEYGGRTLTFLLPGRTLPEVVARLASDELSMADLIALPAPQERLSPLEQLGRLWRAGLLTQVLCDRGRVLALMRGSSISALTSGHVQSSSAVTLRESAFCRRVDGAVVIESGDHGGRIELNDRSLFPIPMLLMEAQTPGEVAERAGVPPEWTAAVLTWLVTIGAAQCVDSPHEQDAGPPWAFADRLFHARSRRGTHVGGYGGTFPLGGTLPAPPVLRPSRSVPCVPLPRPDLGAVAASDPSFTSVCERRRSIREHGPDPITIDELGHFLYRAARITGRARSDRYEYTTRPYPSGGALHELEIYPLVTACTGLEPALYWYDAAAHGLERVSDPTADTAALTHAAQQSSGSATAPQILLILAARFDRVFWKYESMGYALILKNVGVLYQTMYLVATAMGLAPCALGGGDSTAFSRAAGTKLWQESSVGEFMLGRPGKGPRRQLAGAHSTGR